MTRLLPLLVLFAGCGPPSRGDAISEPRPLDRAGLHNVFQLSDRVFSGNAPEDERGYESLQELRIKTILTVDGAPPDVEAAARFGMSYVHLPIGYDDVPEDRAIAIAKAIRDLPGPVYIHCHHGQHRGPAAAAAALRCLEPERSVASLVAFLKRAGTDARYRGLFAAVERAPPTLDETKLEYPSRVPPADLVKRMIDLDGTWDRLKTNASAADAILLVEHFRELKRITADRDEHFQAFVNDAVDASAVLEERLRTNANASTAMKRLGSTCSACHAAFRDNRVSSPP